jgi:hypothetical protein
LALAGLGVFDGSKVEIGGFGSFQNGRKRKEALKKTKKKWTPGRREWREKADVIKVNIWQKNKID